MLIGVLYFYEMKELGSLDEKTKISNQLALR